MKKINICVFFLFLSILILLNLSSSITIYASISSELTKEEQEKGNNYDITDKLQETLRSSTAKTAEKFAGVIEDSLEKVMNKSPEKIRSISHINLFSGITIFGTLVCVILSLTSWFIAKTTNKVLLRQIKDNVNSSWMNLFLDSLRKPIYYFILIYGFYAAFISFYATLSLPSDFNFIQNAAKKIVGISGACLIIYFLYRITVLAEGKIQNKIEGLNNVNTLLLPTTSKIVKTVIGIIGMILIFQNLTGMKITPIITSLGIGGLAVAFAAKDSIANFFGTLTILFDKPFGLKDWIIIDKYEGIVEKVGFRSTKLRLFKGSLISIPNELVVNSTLENVSQRPFIRDSISIGLTYDTSLQKIKDVISTLKWILDKREGMKDNMPARVVFDSLGDWSKNIKITIWYYPPDIWLFRKWKEDLYLDIIENLNEMGVDFAFPSKTLYLSKNDFRSN